MKNKRIGISVLTLILGLICGLGFISTPKQEVKASAAAETTYTQYMLEDGVPVKKDDLTTSAGKMYVNGQVVTSQEELFFVLTESNVQLKAEANVGFELKGWYIAYRDKVDIVENTTNGYIAITDVEQKICDENVVVSRYSLLYKSANLTIQQMQDSLIYLHNFYYYNF